MKEGDCVAVIPRGSSRGREMIGTLRREDISTVFLPFFSKRGRLMNQSLMIASRCCQHSVRMQHDTSAKSPCLWPLRVPGRHGHALTQDREIVIMS